MREGRPSDNPKFSTIFKASPRWPGEGSLHRIQELGKPGAEDQVVIAALGAAQAVLVGGEEEGRETCLEWVQRWAKEGNGEVGNWAWIQ